MSGKILNVASVALVVALLITALLLAWAVISGTLDASQTLGLAGGVIAQTLALLGLLLKNSFDERSHDLKEKAEERLSVEAAEEERRLRVDSALRAVALLEGGGEHLPKVRNGGAVVALTTLGQVPLALALTDMLWDEELINEEAAVQVIDAGIESSDTQIQSTAAAILSGNADKTFPKSSDEYYFPRTLNQGWDIDLPPKARLSLLGYLLKVADHLTDPAEELEPSELRRRLNPLVRVLLDIRHSAEAEDGIRTTATYLLYVLLFPFKVHPGTEEVHGPEGQWTSVNELYTRLGSEVKTPGLMIHVEGGEVAKRIKSRLDSRADLQD